MTPSLSSDERQLKLLMFLVIVLFWILVFQSSRIEGIQGIVKPDTAATLVYARSIAKGYPFRIYPQAPMGTMLSDILSPVIYSLGYFIGFRSPEWFSVWAQILVLIVLLISANFLWVFFKKIAPEVVFPGVLIGVIFPAVYLNTYSTNAGFLFLFFWGALAYMDSFPLFFTFSILAGLSRPEGFLIYSLLFFLRFSEKGKEKIPIFLSGYLILFIPFIVYKCMTGHFLPQGVAPQSLFRMFTFWDSIFIGAKNTFDILKGFFLSFFKFNERTGLFGLSGSGSLPPLVFLIGFLSLLKYKKSWAFAIFFLILLLTLGDGFSIFAGIHGNRHIAFITPIIFLFSFKLIKDFETKIRHIYPFFIVFTTFFVLIQFVGSLPLSRITAKRDFERYKIAKYIEGLDGNEPVIKEAGSLHLDYWLDGSRRIINITPGIEPIFGRYVIYYGRYTEMAELLQNMIDSTCLLVDYFEKNRPIQNWLKDFSIEELKEFYSDYVPVAKIYRINVSKIKDKPPDGFRIFSELDVGDPISENKHCYKYYNDLPVYVGGPLVKGDGFFDGGRYVLVDEFYMDIPQGKSFLVMRIRGVYNGYRTDYSTPITIKTSGNPELQVYINNEVIFEDTIQIDTGYTYIRVPLFSQNGGEVNFRIECPRNIFHYWVVR